MKQVFNLTTYNYLDNSGAITTTKISFSRSKYYSWVASSLTRRSLHVLSSYHDQGIQKRHLMSEDVFYVGQEHSYNNNAGSQIPIVFWPTYAFLKWSKFLTLLPIAI